MKRASIAISTMLAACVAKPPAPAPAPAPEAPRELLVTSDAVDAKRWLAPDAARAIAAGAGAMRVLGADVMAEGERLGAFVVIPEGSCALALTRGSPSIGDVDLFAYDDDGSTFASDESPERDAALLVCPPHPRRLYVVARVMAGSGIVGVGVQEVPENAAQAVAKSVGARGLRGEDTGRLDAWPGLEARVRAHRASLGGSWEDQRRVALPVSPRAATRLSASVEPGRCLDVLVVPSAEAASLEVVAEDAEGRVIARARDRGRDRALLFCASPRARAAPIHVSIRPHGPPAIAAAIIARSAVGAEPEIEAKGRVTHVGSSLDLDAARAEIAAHLAPLGYAAKRTIATGAARVGARSGLTIPLAPGCARVDVIAGKPLLELAASLWDDKGTLIADARAASSAPLFACGKGGALHLDLEAIESPGPFTVELRADKSAPPSLVAHPIAAARLLARLTAGGEALDASSASAAIVVSLEEGQRKTLPIPLAASACADVLVALDGGASGLDLRLTDAAGEGNVTRARDVVADRVCASPSGKQATAEIKVLSGKGDALVLVRPSG